MKGSKTIIPDKTQAKILKRVKAAINFDHPRAEQLAGIRIEDGAAIACNGFVLNAAKLEDLPDRLRVAWRLNRSTPYVSSPLLYDDTLYFLRHNQNILARAGGP